jgi:hypothetical protein
MYSDKMETQYAEITALLVGLQHSANKLSNRKNLNKTWIQETFLSDGVDCKSLFIVGAALSGLSLQNDSVDVTQVFPKNQDVNWVVKTSEILIAESAKEHNKIQIDEVFASIRKNNVHCVIDKEHFSFSPNNIQSMFFGAIIEEIDGVVGHDSLFKQSVMLLKAWMKFESTKYSFQGDLTALSPFLSL